MPGSRHYSWDKGANILGLGRKSLVKVPVDRFCRMDIVKLEEKLQEALDKKEPVVGVTAVFGTTQEGAVDELDKILQLRKKFAKQGKTSLVNYRHTGDIRSSRGSLGTSKYFWEQHFWPT